MAVKQNGIVAKTAAQKSTAVTENKPKATITTMMNSLLDSEGYRRRFDELLGKRAPQFIASIISLVNADKNLQLAFQQAPVTIIQSALKAATYDLPIDPALGYAYIVPFNNSIKLDGGGYQKRMEASFILGWKGMNQLAIRTGVYRNINVVDVRKGELKSYNRLTEEVEIEWVEDEEAREKLPIAGWVGYYRLINGMEKTIYMSRAQVEAHEKKNRKGQYMGKGWRENFDDMAAKTVFRKLIGKYGVMSIDYRTATPEALSAASALADDAAINNLLEQNTVDIAPDDFTEVTDSDESAENQHNGAQALSESDQEDLPDFLK